MRVNFKICTSLKRGIDSSSLPLNDWPRIIAKASPCYLDGMRDIYWFSLRRCGKSWYGSTGLSL